MDRNPVEEAESAAQFLGGAFEGAVIGMVPYGGVVDEVAVEGKVYDKWSRAARIGKALGKMVGGFVAMIGGVSGEIIGTGLTSTGVGSLLGVPAIAVSTVVVVGGVGNMAAGIHDFAEALQTKGSGSGGTDPGGKPAGASKIDRTAFKAEREAFWREEAKNNPGKYSAGDLAKMENGRPPIGPDGHPMELHHVDRTPEG